jgi:hypothetical protein
MFIKYCIIICLAAIGSLFSQTSQWRLIWDKNSESNMAHYKVYRDSKPSASNLLTTVNHTPRIVGDMIMTYTDARLEPGIRYYYRLKAVNTLGLESDYSEEVSAAIPLIAFPDSIKNILLKPNSSLSFDLDSYVTDPDDADHQLKWTTSGAQTLIISVDSMTHDCLFTAPADWRGPEKITLQAEDPDGFFDVGTIDVYSDSTQIEEPGESINVFPVPYLEKEHATSGGITFQNIPVGAELIIFTMLGEVVYKKEDPEENYLWAVKNQENKAVSSGVYMYRVILNNKKIKSGKIIIIR